MDKKLIYYQAHVIGAKALRSVVISIVMAVVAIGGSLLLQGCTKSASNDQNSDQEVADYERDKWCQFEEECAALPTDALQNRKCFCENVLERITQELESDSLNPEERHEAVLTKHNIEKELKIMARYLEQR